MKPNIEELRKKYMENSPEGLTSQDIRNMSEDALLDMDYFLNDDELDDEFGEDGFYIFNLLATHGLLIMSLLSYHLTYVRRTCVCFLYPQNRNFL